MFFDSVMFMFFFFFFSVGLMFMFYYSEFDVVAGFVVLVFNFFI